MDLKLRRSIQRLGLFVGKWSKFHTRTKLRRTWEASKTNVRDYFTDDLERHLLCGAEEACWAHNPKVRGSKPRRARIFSCSEVVITLDFESSIPGSNPGKRILCLAPVRTLISGWHIACKHACYLICYCDYIVTITIIVLQLTFAKLLLTSFYCIDSAIYLPLSSSCP